MTSDLVEEPGRGYASVGAELQGWCVWLMDKNRKTAYGRIEGVCTEIVDQMDHHAICNVRWEEKVARAGNDIVD